MNRALVFDIRRFTVHDGPGIRTTVFLKGCPLSCWWCHNPESRDIHEEKSIKHVKLDGMTFDREEITGQWMSVAGVMAEVLQDQVFYDESGGGVTFSGGEPLLQETFLLELLKESRNYGIHTTLDTSGYTTREFMEHVAEYVDLFLYDLKIIDEEMHKKYTGVSNGIILENLKWLYSSGKKVILRFPVIPGITDTIENIRDMKSFIISSLPHISTSAHQHINTLAHHHISTSANQHISTLPHQLSLLPYHSIARDKYRRFCKSNMLEALPDLNPEVLVELKTEFELLGLEVTIGS